MAGGIATGTGGLASPIRGVFSGDATGASGQLAACAVMPLAAAMPVGSMTLKLRPAFCAVTPRGALPRAMARQSPAASSERQLAPSAPAVPRLPAARAAEAEATAGATAGVAGVELRTCTELSGLAAVEPVANAGPERSKAMAHSPAAARSTYWWRADPDLSSWRCRERGRP
uniref:Uncharacterized protein n=1 Tax=Alexandrium andersonii TaxID=327968 RepID=A0A7S2G2Y5_9DINO